MLNGGGEDVGVKRSVISNSPGRLYLIGVEGRRKELHCNPDTLNTTYNWDYLVIFTSHLVENYVS